ncbi:amidase signature enzyme [Thelephora ganbajun]|uniref:Amidase signature enzyme n=1 Tax=Thelephora ganbajun TaxID=370292 RepID=A0ACB6Z4I0_THEGA|nr:amidase signature enzyme [Thelephora ganbajun]
MFSDTLKTASKLNAHFTVTKELKGQLHGVPISFKDLTGGTPLVKTNVPQDLANFECSNPPLDTIKNPRNVKYNPGGSGEGEGTLLARKSHGVFTPNADLNPGFKSIPTVSGPMARNTEDIEIASRVVFGKSTNYSSAPVLYRQVKLEQKLKSGYYFDDGMARIAPACCHAFCEMVGALRKQGHEVVKKCPRHLYFSYRHLETQISSETKAQTQQYGFLHVMIGWYLEKVDPTKRGKTQSVPSDTFGQVLDAHGFNGTTSPGLASPTLIHEFFLALGAATLFYNLLDRPVGSISVTRIDPSLTRYLRTGSRQPLAIPRHPKSWTSCSMERSGGTIPTRWKDCLSEYSWLGFFSNNQANQDGYTGDGDFGSEGDFGGDGESGSVGTDADHHIGSGMSGSRRGTFVPPDPTREPNGRDLIVGMTNPDAGGGTIDCFDKNVLKNWINFYEPLGMSGKELAKERFAPPTRGVGINLPRHPLPSSSKSGKNKCYKATPISRVGNLKPDFSPSHRQRDGPGFDDGDDDRGVGFAAPEAEGNELDPMPTLVGNLRRAGPQVPEPKSPDKSMDIGGGDKGRGSLADPTEPRVPDSVTLSLRTTYLKDKMQGVGIQFGERPNAEGEAKEITRSEIFGVSGFTFLYKSPEIQTLSPRREGGFTFACPFVCWVLLPPTQAHSFEHVELLFGYNNVGVMRIHV